MSLAQRMHLLLDVFQMTAIALVSVINHYHINGLHLFWDTLYLKFLSYFNSTKGVLWYLHFTLGCFVRESFIASGFCQDAATRSNLLRM